MELLNVGCGTHYAKGWVNADTWENHDIRSDVKVTPGEPYPFEDNTFDAVYLGHVLEHIAWPQVATFLKDISRVAKADAKILITGPDVYKTIKRWSDGQEPWWMVESVMEHQGVNLASGGPEWWDGEKHHWNCHNDRVLNLLETLGFTNIKDRFNDIPKNTSEKTWKNDGITWPVVGFWHWQLAISCNNPK